MTHTRPLQKLYLWACERLYAELAWSYDWVSWLVSWGAWPRWQTVACQYLQGEQLLEIGFGTGTMLAALAQRGHQITGLEYSPAMQRQTTRKLLRRRLIVPRVQAAAQAMPLPTAYFDTILSTFPSSYITDPATLAECARVLRRPTVDQPGGRLVIIMGVTARRSPLAFITRLLLPQRKRSSEAAGSDLHPLPERLRAVGLAPSIFSHLEGRDLVHVVVGEYVQGRTD